MAQQLTYSQNHAVAYAGDKASSEVAQVLAGINKEGSAEIPYGRLVVLGAISSAHSAGLDAQPSVLPSGLSDVVLGIALHSMAHNPAQSTGVLVGDMFDIMTEGHIYVEVEQAVTPADPVFWRAITAGGTGTSVAAGKFRKDADTAKAVAMPNARFLGKAAAGGIVALEIKFP